MAFLIAVTLLAIVATGVVALRDHALPSPRTTEHARSARPTP